LNTPGGLLESTRIIVSDMLESPVPVIVYVAPAGAHAGSAGVFITLAANIAAMAPGTNIGAAHPVQLQGGMDSTMNEKATNDAAAFIRTIAQKRQRNFEWAEDAVRKSLSITELEAADTKVVDLIAKNDRDLLNLIDGKNVEVSAGTKTLHTKNASIETMEMGVFEKILNIISDPNISYILMMLGMYGLLFELYSPGAIFPASLVLFRSYLHSMPCRHCLLTMQVLHLSFLLLFFFCLK
jgi:membrane-bound serine protease (ClpP class)